MTRLRIPPHVPADVLDNVQTFLDGVVEADEEGGFTHYGLFVVGQDHSLRICGCTTPEMQAAVTEAIAVHVLAEKILSGEACSCPDCQQARRDAPNAPDEAAPSFFEKLFGVRK